jgi:hypothetical protein
MNNYTWKHKVLQPSDLPKKAQQFIEMMGIDMSYLRLMTLTPCPNGTFFKSFDTDKSGKSNCPIEATADLSGIYFFSDSVKVGTAIHELTHIYFMQLRLDGFEYDLRGMGERFIKEYGIFALSNYAQISLLENAWEEVICEIVATYGRRGQFDKIIELFNQQPQHVAARRPHAEGGICEANVLKTKKGGI